MTSKWQPVIRQNSRAGCTKCKERRIKCDRKSPSCQNCTVRHLKCPGYDTKYRWKEKHQMRPHESVDAANGSSSKPCMELLIVNELAQGQDQVSVDEDSSCSPSSDGIGPLSRRIVKIFDGVSATPIYPQPFNPADNGARRLIWHYFHFVCNINSCSDSPVDQLRTVTRGLMSSSRLIYFCVLSMAAAHMHSVNPNWSGESLVYLTRAISTLRVQLNEVLVRASSGKPAEQALDQALVGIILLGMSTSWHNASELGLEHIVGSRILLQEYVCPKLYDGSVPDRQKLHFFIGLQTYWETVASFLFDQDLEQLDYLHDACIALSTDTIHVHPWTGISSMVWMLLAKAGSVARNRLRLLAEWSSSGQEESLVQMDKLMLQASVVEAQLLSYELPLASNISNTTEHTSIFDLYRIAQCCRFAALLELYKSFGSVWDTKSALEVLVKEWNTPKEWSNLPESQEPFVYSDIYEFLSLGILRILRCIPADSSTRCLQPFLLLIAASALYKRGHEETPHPANLTPESLIGRSENLENMSPEAVGSPDTPKSASHSSGSNSPDTVAAWRNFAHQRVTAIEQGIKLDSLRRIRVILEEVWACNDEIQRAEPIGAEDNMAQNVHWINVMEEKQLQFMF